MAIKDTLKDYNLKPSKALGQNFLVDQNILEKIIKAAEVSPDDTVLEIGPGTGILTKELSKYARKVIAVEKDRKIMGLLEENLKDCKNVELINADILKADIQGLALGTYKVVANLPYYITSPIIRKFLENPPVNGQPELMVLMVQKEVGQRICAAPPNMNLLAVSVQFYAQPEIVSWVSKNSFWPKPKVDSAIIKITPRIDTDNELINTDLFFKIVKAGFVQPRKQLLNNLSKSLEM
jgi:16S rRNA (adenine1518-N6/adenine1519-N6)-dimethyltransferase